MRCRRALWVYSQPFILFRDLFRRVQTCSVEFCCFLSDQLLVKQSVCCGLDRTRVGQGMKNNSQAMLVLVVAARTGGTNNLYYWTESRQKKTDAVRVTPCRTSACGGLVAVACLAAAAVLVLAQFVEVGHQPQSGLISS